MKKKLHQRETTSDLVLHAIWRIKDKLFAAHGTTAA